jgi:prephenate dehydrogenase
MVQLLCSASMMAITILPKESYREIQQRMDDNFRAFIRLAGSDPVMWRDIFILNGAHIEAVVRRFTMYFISLVRMVEAGDSGGLKKRLESARKKREEFYSRLHHAPAADDLVLSDYGPAKSYALSYLELLPVLIATAIMDSVPEEEYEHAAGAGFYGFTRSIVVPGATDVTRLLMHRKALVVAAEGFLQQMDFLMAAIKKGQLKMLEEALARARESYHILVKK